MGNGPGLKMYFLVKMGMFHCYVSLPEGRSNKFKIKVPVLNVHHFLDKLIISDSLVEGMFWVLPPPGWNRDDQDYILHVY